jgi:transcriptional regulator with XRE-family HTH domain
VNKHLSRIKAAREKRNYCQEFVAEQLNISQRAYSSIENGESKLSVNRMIDLAHILDITVEEILADYMESTITNNFNNDAEGNQGSLIVNNTNVEELITLYEKIIKSKDEEIAFLRNLISSKISK